MRLLLTLSLLSFSAFGAITANTQWEVRTTGASTNGGGFDATIAGAGTDMSVYDNRNASGCTSCQSTTANLSVLNATTSTGTTVTSATASFTSALVGNVVYLALGGGSCNSGTVTASWRLVTSVTNSTTMEIDSTPTGSGNTCTGVTLNIGGALDLPSRPPYAPGNTIWVKATANYATALSAFSSTAGTETAHVKLYGYNATRGDNGKAVIQIPNNFGTGINITAANIDVANFSIDCNSKTSSTGMTFGAANSTAENLYIYGGCSSNGLNFTGARSVLKNVYVTGVTSAATAAIYMNGPSTSSPQLCLGCVAVGNSTIGIHLSNTASVRIVLNSIAANNSGATTDGIKDMATTAHTVVIANTALYGNGQHGLNYTAASGPTGLSFFNNIVYGNTGYGINSGTADYSGTKMDIHDNRFYSAGSGERYQFPIGVGDATLTADPFTNAAGGDFSLNNVAGGGAACRGVGYPGGLGYGGTNYSDIGPLQVQLTSGGSGGQKGYGTIQ